MRSAPRFTSRSPRLALAGAIAAVALLAGPGDARAEAPRIGLVVATRVNMADSEADALASRLGDALREQLVVDVIAGAEARRRLPRAGLPDDCVARPSCVKDVATRLDGDELLFLFLVRIGPRLQIDVTWAEPRRGSITSRPALVVEGAAGKPADGAAIDRALRAAPRSLLPAAARRPARPAQAASGTDLPAPAALPAEPMSSGTEVGSSIDGESMSTEMPVPRDDVISRGRGRRLTPPVVVFGAVSAAALATGVGFAVAARQDYTSLEDDGCDRMACPGIDDRVDTLEKRALVADILFATAGAAALTGLVFFLVSDDAEPPVRVGAAAGGDSAVLSVAGRF